MGVASDLSKNKKLCKKIQGMILFQTGGGVGLRTFPGVPGSFSLYCRVNMLMWALKWYATERIPVSLWWKKSTLVKSDSHVLWAGELWYPTCKGWALSCATGLKHKPLWDRHGFLQIWSGARGELLQLWMSHRSAKHEGSGFQQWVWGKSSLRLLQWDWIFKEQLVSNSCKRGPF